MGRHHEGHYAALFTIAMSIVTLRFCSSFPSVREELHRHAHIYKKKISPPCQVTTLPDHHTHCECIQYNNVEWWSTLWRPIEKLLHQFYQFLFSYQI